MDLMTLNWLFWLGGFFLTYEISAIALHGITLSEQVWNWFSLGQKKVHWQLRRFVFLSFWLILGIGHFYFQTSALWSVIVPGVPFALVIILSTFVWKDAATAARIKGAAMPVQFSWVKSVGKGVQAVLELLASVAIVAAVDAMILRVDEAPELKNLGLPAVLIPVVLLGIRMFTNWWKVKRAGIGR